MNGLANVHAIVTGAASGLGRAIASRLAAEGAVLTLLDRDRAGLADAVAHFPASARAFMVTVDVTDSGAVDAAVEQAVLTHGAPRVVVNCAGVIVRRNFLETTPEHWSRILAVNVIGYVNVLRAAVPKMMAGGSIVQIASSAAHRGGHGEASYAASKGAVLALTRHLAGELAGRGIRVNSISPGPTITALNQHIFANADALRSIEEAVPLGRIGKPVDVTGAALFLASEASAYVTGIDIRVDGGFTSQVHLGSGASAYRAPAQSCRTPDLTRSS